MSNNTFQIKYRHHYIGPLEAGASWKIEVVVNQDGCIKARKYMNDGANMHFRIVEKITKDVSPKLVYMWHDTFMDLIRNQNEIEMYLDDTVEEIILETPGLSIHADRGLSDGTQTIEDLAKKMLDELDLRWSR